MYLIRKFTSLIFNQKKKSFDTYNIWWQMDNALIDDRRIHVDFSQSVAKLWSQYRRKDQQNGNGNSEFVYYNNLFFKSMFCSCHTLHTNTQD